MASAEQYEKIYFYNGDLPSLSDTIVTEGDLAQGICEVVGDDVKCIQKCGDIWKVYLTGKESVVKLENDGFKLKDRYTKSVEKITTANLTICGLPHFNEDINTKIRSELKSKGYEIHGNIKREKIKDPITGKNTNVDNGNKEVTVSWSHGKKGLPRNTELAGYTCRIYHHGQKTTQQEIKCYAKVCWVCRQLGHEFVMSECPKYIERNENVVIFQNKQDEAKFLSLDSPCKIKVRGKVFESAVHAYKTIRDEGELGNWETKTEKHTIMKEILSEKFKHESSLRETLGLDDIETVLAFASYDCYWGTGLSREDTLHTDPFYWPGKNHLGRLFKEIALAREKITAYSINIGGIKSVPSKKSYVNTFLKQESFDILFLQETHFRKEDDALDLFDSELLNNYTCEQGYSNSSYTRGVSILVKKSLNMEIEKLSESDDGSWLFVKVTYKGRKLYLINVYAPSGTCREKKDKRIEMFDKVFTLIKEKKDKGFILLGGDFNCKLDDKRSEDSKDLLRNQTRILKLTDAWAHYGKGEGFTCYNSEKNPTRIDYIFLSENFPFLNISLETQPQYPEGNTKDHIGIYFEFSWANLKKKKVRHKTSLCEGDPNLFK